MARSYLSIVRVGCVVGLMGSVHRFVQASRAPCRTRCPLWYTLHSQSSKITLQPPSQNFLIDISVEWAKSGTMCASVRLSGSHEMSKLHTCVETMISPFGIVIVTGLVAGCMFFTFAFFMQKWPVVPESATPSSILGSMAAFCAANAMLIGGFSVE